MADITTPVRDALDAELDAAFLDAYANPDGLTGRQLAELHIANFVRGVINEYRRKQAVTTAEAAVSEETDLS